MCSKMTIVKRMMAFLFVVSVFLINTSVATAVSLDVQGYVHPYAGTVINGGTTSIFGQVDYRFDVVGGSSGMNFLNIEFEDDIFLSVAGLSVLTSGWSGTADGHTDRHIHLSGSTLPTGDQLEFSLFDVTVVTAALEDASYWDEGGVWHQAWAALYLDPTNPLGFSADGGSTAPVPEPASLVLMGSGLAGLGLWSWRRRKKSV